MSEPERMAYVGIAECGCIRAAGIDEPNHRNDTAKFVAGIIKDGLRLEKMATADVRAAKWGCEKCEPKRFAKQETLFGERPDAR